ncbi:hypothetical protein CDCA_CDCA06G1843 [Cyanidium caldarium]|uniref:DUF1995 domain-containing protein n=1 Tax=Cyanidium caldarium TaxID=2771 RepID=A0AAV9IVG7_CYACA|nr:hypothetical protein CDCA_CDCA06G1843 [Cyanidium caldarium]
MPVSLAEVASAAMEAINEAVDSGHHKLRMNLLSREFDTRTLQWQPVARCEHTQLGRVCFEPRWRGVPLSPSPLPSSLLSWADRSPSSRLGIDSWLAVPTPQPARRGRPSKRHLRCALRDADGVLRRVRPEASIAAAPRGTVLRQPLQLESLAFDQLMAFQQAQRRRRERRPRARLAQGCLPLGAGRRGDGLAELCNRLCEEFVGRRRGRIRFFWNSVSEACAAAALFDSQWLNEERVRIDALGTGRALRIDDHLGVIIGANNARIPRRMVDVERVVYAESSRGRPLLLVNENLSANVTCTLGTSDERTSVLWRPPQDADLQYVRPMLMREFTQVCYVDPFAYHDSHVQGAVYQRFRRRWQVYARTLNATAGVFRLVAEEATQPSLLRVEHMLSGSP